MTDSVSRFGPALAIGFLACQPAPGLAGNSPACTVLAPARDLPGAVFETSGLAFGRRSPGVLWTHNDSGNEPILYALDTTGTFLGQVRVIGASVLDWEDIAAGPCDSGSCLFIGDTGDNGEQRDSISFYVVPEPAPADSVTLPAVVFHARYPDRPQDTEAIFVLPTGDIYLVTKGRRDSIAIYRFPQSEQHPGSTARLERVRGLWPRPSNGSGRVTGASATPNGRFVAIRSYGALYIYETVSLLGAGPARPTVFNLRPLNERQGEGIAISDGGDVRLSSEGERSGSPEFSRLKCDLPEPAVAAQNTPGAQASNP